MLSALLFLHILVAVIMSGVALHAIANIVRRQHQRLPGDAKSLSILLLAEAVSGSLLGLFAPEFSAARFCINVGVYVSVFLLVELAIFIALKKSPSLVFPHLYARSSAGISMAAFVLVVLLRI